MCFLEFLIFGLANVAVFVSFLTRDGQRAAVEDRLAGACRRACSGLSVSRSGDADDVPLGAEQFEVLAVGLAALVSPLLGVQRWPL